MTPSTATTALDALAPDDWDRLARPGTAPLSYGFLEPCQSSLEGLRWSVLTLDDAEGRALLRCPAFVHRITAGGLGPRPVRAALRRLGISVMETGNPCAPSAPLLAAPGFGWLEALDRHFEDHREASVLVVRDVVAGSQVARALERRSFALVGQRPTFVLDTPGSQLGDYLTAMRASYRRRARRTLGLPLEVEVVSDFEDLGEVMAELFAINAARSRESRTEHIASRAIVRWSKLPTSRALSVRDPDTGARCLSLVLVDAPVVHFLRCGFPEASGRELGLYRRTLYELVRLAYTSGCRFVDFGVTSAEPKLRVGAQPIELQIWARHRRRWLQPLLRAARRPAPVSVRRRVFRDPVAVDCPWYRP